MPPHANSNHTRRPYTVRSWKAILFTPLGTCCTYVYVCTYIHTYIWPTTDIVHCISLYCRRLLTRLKIKTGLLYHERTWLSSNTKLQKMAKIKDLHKFQPTKIRRCLTHTVHTSVCTYIHAYVRTYVSAYSMYIRTSVKAYQLIVRASHKQLCWSCNVHCQYRVCLAGLQA